MPAGSRVAVYVGSPEGRTNMLYAGVALTAITGIGLLAFHAFGPQSARPKTSKRRPGAPPILPKVPKGRLACPAEVGKLPPKSTTISPHDFVILRLVSHDQAYGESVWGHVLSISPDGEKIHVELSTPLTPSGLQPIHTEKHGFSLGEKIKISKECVWDVLHPGDRTRYDIICGVMLSELGYPVLPKSILAVHQGDIVSIVVGNTGSSATALPGLTWNEKLRVAVTSTGKTGDIVHAVIWDEPKLVSRHGLRKNSKLEFTRDCIVET